MQDQDYVRKISYKEIAFLGDLGITSDLREMVLRCWAEIKHCPKLDISMFKDNSKGFQFTYAGYYLTHALDKPTKKEKVYFLMSQEDLSKFEGLIFEPRGRATFKGPMPSDSVSFEKLYRNDLICAQYVNTNPIYYRGTSVKQDEYKGTWSFDRTRKTPIICPLWVHMADEGIFVLRKILTQGTTDSN